MKMASPFALACAFIAFVLGVAVAITRLLRIGRRPANYPPGPPTIPILGNFHQMPSKDVHLQFEKWAKEYGPIFSLILGTKTLIVLTSDTAVKDLMDKRSGIYSSRQDAYVGSDLVSGGLRVLLMVGLDTDISKKYGPTWRMIRKMIHNILNINAARSYVPYQDLENKQMLVGLLDEPKNFVDHLRRYTNSLTTQMVFGFRTTSIDDPKLQQLFHGFEKYSEANSTGGALALDLFPFLKSLPDFCVPVRPWAKELHRKEMELYLGHWMNVKKAIKAGTAKPCFCVDLVKAQDVEGFSDALAGYTSGSLLEAGSDTTAATLHGFIQAMLVFPDVQRKAQEELDSIVGPDRLPTVEDMDALQYIRGCVKESLRWMPTNILGVPHAVTQDDAYMGYKIPKGAGIILNVWGIHMDPNRHPNPRAFDPSRYAQDFQSLGEAATNSDPSKRDQFVFGAGRRVCQGMHIAERSLFLGMARILWGFNMEKVRGPAGSETTPDINKLTQGLFVAPEEFPAHIYPRSEKHAQIMRKAWTDCASLLDNDMQWKEIPKGMAFSTYTPDKKISDNE